MTKQEFVDQVANSSGLGKSEAGKAVDSVLTVIEETLSRGGEVSFTGFGKFSVADRGARQGVNPQTGQRIQIAATRVPRFSAGSALKSAVKSGAGGGGGVREWRTHSCLRCPSSHPNRRLKACATAPDSAENKKTPPSDKKFLFVFNDLQIDGVVSPSFR